MIECRYRFSIYFDEIKAVSGTLLGVSLLLFLHYLSGSLAINANPLTVLLAVFVLVGLTPQALSAFRKRNAPRVVELYEDQIAFRRNDDSLAMRYKDAEAVKSKKGVISVYHGSDVLRIYPSIRNYELILKRLSVPDEPKNSSSEWWDKELFPWKGDNTK